LLLLLLLAAVARLLIRRDQSLGSGRTLLERKQPFSQNALHQRSNGGPMNQLKHEQVGLKKGKNVERLLAKMDVCDLRSNRL